MITMTELARLAGVSQPTVSRVLNGNPSVKPEVAERVMEYARMYNYQPNMIAKSLNGSRTYLLAVIIPNIANPFFADIIKEIEQEAGKNGYSLLIFNSDYSREKEERYLSLLQQYRVDGLLIAPVRASAEGLKPFCRLSIPWMVITNDVADIDSVYVSHEKAGVLVASHLADCGVEKYIFVGARHDKKFSGFQKGLSQRGIDTRAALTVFWEEDREKMLELLVSYLKEIPQRAGIFAMNDMEGLVVMNALMAAGIEIPKKAALVGFDNTFISKQILPAMTSVSQPVHEMCRFAVNHLLEKIEGKHSSESCHIELEAEVIIRASSGFPGTNYR